MRTWLLDLDGSAAMRTALDRLAIPVLNVDLADLAPDLRLWASQRSMAALRGRLFAAQPPRGGPILHLMGSGDYHHLTCALLETVRTPVTVVHFDNHPDWARFGAAYHCGGWVNRALEIPMVARIITIGPCSADLAWPQFKGANLAALRSGRLELYPWKHAPSVVIGYRAKGASFRAQDGRLTWRNAGDETWQAFLEHLLSRIVTVAVWITVDKDVLSPDEAATNWDQGEMPLQALLQALRYLGREKHIVGADICGDYSAPSFGANLVKRWEAWRDQPPPPSDSDLIRNIATNQALLATFAEILD